MSTKASLHAVASLSETAMLLREAIKARGLTVTTASTALGVHYSALYSWLNGQNTPGKNSREKIRAALGLDLDSGNNLPVVIPNKSLEGKEALKKEPPRARYEVLPSGEGRIVIDAVLPAAKAQLLFHLIIGQL